MTEIGGLLTPTKIAAWLECEHVLTLSEHVGRGDLVVPEFGASPMARLLMDKGVEHEKDFLARYIECGRSVFDASTLRRGNDFDDWVAACEGLLGESFDVVYQMPLSHNGMRGVADFVERVGSSESPTRPSFEPVDAKLSRREAKTAHVLQLCFYADALEALVCRRPSSRACRARERAGPRVRTAGGCGRVLAAVGVPPQDSTTEWRNN